MNKAILIGCVIAVVGCARERDARSEVATLATQSDPVDLVATAIRERLQRAKHAERPAPPIPPTPPASVDPDPIIDAPPRPAPTWSAFDASNRCERFRLTFDDNGHPRYQRIRRRWTKADQQRFASLVTLVASEMGADPRLLKVWALRESSYRPHALHLLNPDVEAATSAWRRLRYSPSEEAELQEVLATASPRGSAYWEAKARLRQVQTFRDNDYTDAVLPLEVLAADGSTSSGSEHAWAFGYGAFGFNPAYYVPVWDRRSPPWVFCQDDGLAAIITAVWVARAAQRECESQGLPGSYAVVDRRFSRGHCGPVGPKSKFRERAERVGLDPDQLAKLGRKWPYAGTERAEIRAFMRERAVEAGLLPNQRIGS